LLWGYPILLLLLIDYSLVREGKEVCANNKKKRLDLLLMCGKLAGSADHMVDRMAERLIACIPGVF
jgi:hypothetical protein